MKSAFLSLLLIVSATAASAADLAKYQKGEIYIGKKDAPLEIIEYASMSCSHCADFSNDVFPQVYEEYIKTGKARFLMRHFILNEPAMNGAKLVECAPKGKRYKFIKVLFKLQEKWAYTTDSKKGLKTIANMGGLSDEAFEKCMADEALEKKILDQRMTSEKELKIEGTPTFFVNGEKVGTIAKFDQFKEILDKKLEEAAEEPKAAAPKEKAAETKPAAKKE